MEVLMPQDKDLKRLVRERMATAGERYTVARQNLTGGPVSPTLRDARGLVQALSDTKRAEEAFKHLLAIPSDLRRQVALEGLEHRDWRVRRRCARVLDDVILTDGSIRGLTRALADEHPKVRAAALHSLACEDCKPDGCTIDAAEIGRVMLDDPSSEVRRHALGALWGWTEDGHSLDELRAIARDDPSARVRAAAEDLLTHFERQRAGNEARLRLPAALQAKMARHPGKWVAVADGRIVAADRFVGQIRRDVKGQGFPDAIVCWVPSEVAVR